MNDSETYWNNRYLKNDTGWDLNTISFPLKSYIDQLDNKDLKILIPGAGNAYEAEYLFNNGFTKINIVDIAKTPLENFRKRCPNFPIKQLLNVNFFDINQKFDLILEQTFFCALLPQLRTDYVSKMYDILNSNGKLVGLLFDFPLTENGPPYGGNIKLYNEYFSNLFSIEIMENCHNSHPNRIGKELFFKALKRKIEI